MATGHVLPSSSACSEQAQPMGLEKHIIVGLNEVMQGLTRTSYSAYYCLGWDCTFSMLIVVVLCSAHYCVTQFSILWAMDCSFNR